MCVSAAASFVASGSLAGIGVASVLKTPREFRWIAAIPVFFAIQQAIEGAQWLAIDRGAPSIPLGYAFLFFAFLVWPAYIPLAVWRAEPAGKRKRLLVWFVALGVVNTIELSSILLLRPLAILVHPGGIEYSIAINLIEVHIALYAALVCISPFLSAHRFFRWFGLALAASAAVTLVLFFDTFFSMWCFVAALLSAMLFFLLPKRAAAVRAS